MNPDISRGLVQLAGLAGVARRSSNATGAVAIVDRPERTCQYGHARTQSRVRRQRERFSHEAGAMLDVTPA